MFHSLLLAGIFGYSAASVVVAVEPPAKSAVAVPSAGASEGNTMVAIVAGRPIYERQVEQMMAAATHGKAVAGEAAARIKAAVLLQLVDRKLAENYLEQAPFVGHAGKSMRK